MPDATRSYREAKGPYTDLRQLTSLYHACEAFSLPLPRWPSSPISGTLTSRFRGRGMDFAEVRSYQPGDDIRSIDWRVTARTGKAHTKVFQDERERPVLLLVDQSGSLFFGSRRAFKSVVAVEVAVMLAWAAFKDGDRTGGLVFNESTHSEVRPRRSHHSVLRLINQLHDFNHRLARTSMNARVSQGQEGGLDGALRKCCRVARHGNTVFIISDFSGRDWNLGGHLQRLASHNQVFGIWITDRMEAELPPPDDYLVTNGGERAILDAGSEANRLKYAEEFRARRRELEDLFTHLKAPLIELRTDQAASEVLKSINRPGGRHG